ncbi:hypothetical protein K6119_04185 [Paracrocinitomix mangrovi]|uniref:hypothetical protein n=1 Tax=Paracrocinitomix mangrovi TaxID=2862509 RepID=UPI001C8E05CD|nr:hypothetical protein [Paracrocinitomix mangrovi]UKN02712.1 hypothetical protein K6119_04185 [Paracrocinitomix mangrovi]
MKKFVIICLIMVPFVGYCDTLDYWTVHLNSKLLGQYNELSNDNEIVLKSDSILETDTIFITYGNDHPCVKCEYYFAVKDSLDGIKIHVERKHQIPARTSYPLKKLKNFHGQKEFLFFLYEDDWTGDHNIYTVLFRLKIE